MKADPQAAEHVRYLTERLCRANGIQRIEPELVDSLLGALRPLVSGEDPQKVLLTSAALEAIERQNDLTRAALDDHLCRALEMYLALPTPGGRPHKNGKPVHHRRPAMAGERRGEKGKASAANVAALPGQEKAPSSPSGRIPPGTP